MSQPFLRSIFINNSEIFIARIDIVAPIGEPAIALSGEDELLIVTPAGAIFALDAGNTAIESSGEDAFILNLGEIFGDFNGISSTGDEFDLINLGLIASNSRAVDLAGGDDLLVINGGTLLGTGDQRNGTLYIDGDVDEANVINTRRGVIDAGEGNLGDGISIQVGAADEDAVSEDINVTNAGFIAGRGQPLFADGARVAANGSSGLRFVSGASDSEAVVTGTVTNSGIITSEAAVGFLGGVVVEDGVAFAGVINNSGLIEGVQNGLYLGNAEHELLIENTGSIVSDSRAVNLDGDNILLVNSGDIVGTGDQRNGTIYLDGTADNISIVNEEASAIDAGEGNLGDGISIQVGAADEDAVSEDINVTNAGFIAGRGQPLFADGARVAANGSSGLRFVSGASDSEAVVTGTVTNSGIITSEAAVGFLGGVVVEDGVAFAGVINNSGLIEGVQNGLYLGNAEHELLIENAGSIVSDSRAVNLDGDNILLVNSGDIVGTGDQRNGTIYLDGTADNISIVNEEASAIDAGEGNLGDGISIQVGAADEDAVSEDINVTNAGFIAGRGQPLFADGARVAANGSSGLRFVSGASDSEAVVTGTVTNSGIITSEAAVGFLGGVVVEDGVAFAGVINNSGLIEGVQNGLYLGNAEHELLIENAGSIVSDSRAVNLDGDNILLVNSGDIVSTGDQRNGTIYLDGTADNISIVNEEASAIDAGEGNLGDGISIQVGAADEDAVSEDINVTNAGFIAGRGQPLFADGARVAANGSSGLRFVSGASDSEAVVTGTVTNSGIITSEAAVGFLGGVVVEDGVAFAGVINNSGLIEGVQNGLYLGNAEHELLIENTGSIVSDSRAVNLDGDNILLVNSGDIVGTGDQRNGTIYLDGTADNISIVNEETGVVDAGGGNSGSGVSVQVGADGDAQSDNIGIINDGLIQGRGTDNVPAGVRLFVGSGLDAANFNGSIINQANGVIASETAAGILIEEGVIFDGLILNEGEILGGNGIAIDAAGALGAVNIINNGELNGNVLLGQGDDAFTQDSLGETATVSGGAGSDIFTVEAGVLIIEDFNLGEDTIDLSAFFDSGAAALAAANQDGDATVFDLGADASLVLAGLAEADLTAGSFDFA